MRTLLLVLSFVLSFISYPGSDKKERIYGEAYGFWTSYPDTGEDFTTIYLNKKDALAKGRRMCKLMMDIYQPEEDGSANRPLLVFIHGGAFFAGDKATEPAVRICEHFASLGYVVASINYRLGFRPTPSAIVEAGYCAYQDADAAIRFLLYYKDIYRIDPSRIFVAGSSAGAITALNVAFMREWDRPGRGAEYARINPWMNESYHVRGVANLWGAVMDLGMLKNTNTAIISFHGRWDPVVPFEYDYPFQELSMIKDVLFDKMYGSGAIQEEAVLLGRKAELYVYDEDHNISPRLNEIIGRTSSFFSELMR